MMMAFKYQVSLSLRANDILLITLNHLDMIRTFTEDSPATKPQVDYIFNLLLQVISLNNHISIRVNTFYILSITIFL